MKITKRVTMLLAGESEGDIKQAFNEASRLVREGLERGSDGNKTGQFVFKVESVSE